jgi:hypothetical protein
LSGVRRPLPPPAGPPPAGPRLSADDAGRSSVSGMDAVTEEGAVDAAGGGSNRDMEALECPVCLDEVGSSAGEALFGCPSFGRCDATFHAACLHSSLASNPTCPCCRGPVPEHKRRACAVAARGSGDVAEGGGLAALGMLGVAVGDAAAAVQGAFAQMGSHDSQSRQQQS